MGLYKKKQVANFNDQKAAELIFEAGFSTADEKNLLAGRGIGMDLIKNKVQNAGGNITVDFESGKFCEFTIELFLPESKTILNIEELKAIEVEDPKS